jgi:hypothetical protein
MLHLCYRLTCLPATRTAAAATSSVHLHHPHHPRPCMSPPLSVMPPPKSALHGRCCRSRCCRWPRGLVILAIHQARLSLPSRKSRMPWLKSYLPNRLVRWRPLFFVAAAECLSVLVLCVVFVDLFVGCALFRYGIPVHKAALLCCCVS